MCKECRKDYIRQHYLDNKEKYIAKASVSNRKARRKLKDYKSGLKCQECGENHPACLDFHHKDPSTKLFCISNSSGKYSEKKILEEIAKCDILCANCHRKHHYKE